MKSAAALLVLAALLGGCGKAEVTEADAARTRQEFSQQNYEQAMRAAGKGDQLQREKQQAQSRGDQ